jgi:hypothetical protein
MVGGQNGGKVGPPCPSVAQELLCYKECLLMFGAINEPKLELNSTKPMIGLKRFSYFSEGWQVSCQELRMCDLSLTTSVTSTMSTTVGAGHKLAQQLGLLIP